MSDPKRKRASTPEEEEVMTRKPMAEGVKCRGYINESNLILEKYEENERKNPIDAEYLMELISEHVMENIGHAETRNFGVAVQLANTFFEIAAAVTNLAEAKDDKEAEALDALYNHAKSGLDLIGAADADTYDDDLDEPDPAPVETRIALHKK